MPFIGNQPAESYSAFQKQDFTTSATTSYTLDNPVANANELALFINFVRQEPTTAYSASGTSLTLTSATASSDDMYCVYLGKAVQTVNPPNASVGTSQLASSLDLSSKTVTLASNMKNTPAFHAYLSADQTSISGNSNTKVQINTEVLDTNGNYDNSTNYRFTPTTAGKYFVYANLVGEFDSNKLFTLQSKIYKNGSAINVRGFGSLATNYGNQVGFTVSLIAEANGTTDNLATDKSRYTVKYNIAQNKIIEWFIENNSTDENRYLQSIKKTYEKLDKSTIKEDYASFLLPKNYFEFIGLKVKGSKENCKNQLFKTREIKGEDVDNYFIDSNLDPSFKYRETFYTIADNAVQVFKKDFNIDSAEMSYYRYPKQVELESPDNPESPFKKEQLDFDEKLINRIIFMTVALHDLASDDPKYQAFKQETIQKF